MAVAILMPVNSLLFALCMGEDINLTQFLLTFFIGSKSRCSSIDTIGLRVPTQTLWDFPLFHVSPSFKTCPSSKCAAATNCICSDFDIFIRQSITLSHIWYSCFSYGSPGCWLSTLINNWILLLFLTTTTPAAAAARSFQENGCCTDITNMLWLLS